MEKQCPYCGEFIPAKAMKCRHCGQWLDNTDRRDRQHADSVLQSPLVKTFLLFVGALAIVAALFVGIRQLQDANPPATANDTAGARPLPEQTAADSRVEPAVTHDPSPTATAEAAVDESVIDDSTPMPDPVVDDERRYHLPYYGTVEPGATMARAVLSGNFANTWHGMTANRFNGSGVYRSSDRVLMATTDDGFRYQYFFDSEVGTAGDYNPRARLIGVAASKPCNGNEHLECYRFDSHMEGKGCPEVYYNVFATPQGNYASAGYKNGRLWIYFYYPESPTLNEAAPRS